MTGGRGEVHSSYCGAGLPDGLSGLTWILPLVFFVLIGRLLSRQLSKVGSMNAMQLGKSNAKI